MQPEEMRGAWAGEIGQTQFMPSTYLKYATSADGGDVADLVGSSADALASAANFLKAKGWKRGQGFHEGEPNFAALLEWNAAPVYAKTIAFFADRLAEPTRSDRPRRPARGLDCGELARSARRGLRARQAPFHRPDR